LIQDISAPGRLFFSGDKHGEINMADLSSKSFPEGRTLGPLDIVAVAGDMGLLFHPRQTREERWWMDWLSKKGWTTAFAGGNHENYDLLNALPREERFGGTVGVLAPNIVHLRNAQIFELGGRTVFVMGGAASTDFSDRIPGKSWWPEEIPSRAEMEYGFDLLASAGWKVDVVLSHTAPVSLMPLLLDETLAREQDRCRSQETLRKRTQAIEKAYAIHGRDPVAVYLEEILQRLSFRQWYFGHHHLDLEIRGGFRALYHQTVMDLRHPALSPETPEHRER
jgi:hypothetical protein